MPENVQSRFTVLDRPTESPGQCLVCGAVNRPVVDFGVDIDWADQGFGRAYLCVFCVKQAASKFPDMERDLVPREFAEAELDLFKEGLTRELHDVLVKFSPRDYGPVPVVTIVAASTDDSEDSSGNAPDYGTYEPGQPESDVQDDRDDSGEGPSGLSGNPGHGLPKPAGFDLRSL